MTKAATDFISESFRVLELSLSTNLKELALLLSTMTTHERKRHALLASRIIADQWTDFSQAEVMCLIWFESESQAFREWEEAFCDELSKKELCLHEMATELSQARKDLSFYAANYPVLLHECPIRDIPDTQSACQSRAITDESLKSQRRKNRAVKRQRKTD